MTDETSVTIVRPDATAEAKEGAAVVEVARAMVIDSAESHAEALQYLRDLATMRKRFVGLYASSRRASHAAHKAICAAQNELTDPIDEARNLIEPKAITWSIAAREAALAERIKREAAARAAEEARILAEAEAAEAAGDHELAETIVSEPVSAPVAPVAPDVARVSGTSEKVRWVAEVVDLQALAAYVGSNGMTQLVLPNQTALNEAARSQRGMLAIPGVRAIQKTSLAITADEDLPW